MVKELTRRRVLAKGLKTSVWLAGTSSLWTRSVESVWAEIEERSGQSKGAGLLSARHRNALRATVDEIIPAADGMPAASQVKAVDYIEIVLAEVDDLGKLVTEALKRLQDTGQNRFGLDFDELTSQQRVELLREMEVETQEFGAQGLLSRASVGLFATLRDVVYEAYYTSPEVWPLIGYEFFPTDRGGPSMKPFDESILDAVRRRPKHYREIPDEKRKG